MTRKRVQHQPSKKKKKSQNQTLYLAFTAIIIILAIASLILLQEPSDTNPESKDGIENGSENDGTWLFAMDTDNVGSKYQASAIPTLAIINTEGDIVYYNRGVHSKELLMPYIESAADGTAESLGDAPDFTLETFNDKTFKLSDYKGKVVLIDLMAEYCDPCADQMPELQKIKLEKGEDIVILSVDVAYPNETENLVRETFGTYIKE
jgi:hypothetical protein